MAIPKEEGGLKDSRDIDNNIINIDSTIRIIMSPQLKNISTWFKVMGGCECCISAKIMHSLLLSWWGCYLKNQIVKPQCAKQKVWLNGQSYL